MNLKTKHESFPIFSGAKPDIERIETIWKECLSAYGGPFLFGEKPTIADAMYAPVATRFITYAVELPPECEAYCHTIEAWEPMQQWKAAALAEPEEMEEMDAEF
jgi:glutathione S-transferase